MILAVNKRAFEEYDDDRKRLARHLHSTAAQELAALQLSLSLIPVDEGVGFLPSFPSPMCCEASPPVGGELRQSLIACGIPQALV